MQKDLTTQARPLLNEHISLDDFLGFYWTKSELTEFCKSKSINPSGGKIELSTRIALFLEKGIITQESSKKNAKPVSTFDWNNAVLTESTLITDNYKNTENVRAFFKDKIGTKFSFNVQFMDWMKENTGLILAEAVTEWKRLHQLKKDKSQKTEIAPQFEYNRYMRDFMADNPELSTKDAMRYWKLKRAQKGNNIYSKEDFKLI